MVPSLMEGTKEALYSTAKDVPGVVPSHKGGAGGAHCNSQSSHSNTVSAPPFLGGEGEVSDVSIGFKSMHLTALLLFLCV